MLIFSYTYAELIDGLDRQGIEIVVLLVHNLFKLTEFHKTKFQNT
jgi:hypothetical protein